jgi:serine/threonine-protein kinase
LVSVEHFGPYRLDELIGRGGMGEVYRAYDTRKERVVALKRLPPGLAGDGDFQARFRREARIAAQLREPHIIPIHDYGEIDGQLFIDMRLVEGVDLASVLEQFGPLHPVRAVEIVTQIASALDAAHTEGLQHRDIKPSNVLLAGGGPDRDYVYLIDFGIVHAANATSLTAVGTTIGTLDYMAPERFLTGHGDHRVDIYALGGVLHTMLTGSIPFPGEDGPAQMYAHVHTPPPSPSEQRPELPVGLDAVVATALAKTPEDRYPSAGALADAARTALTTPTRNATARPTNTDIPAPTRRPDTSREPPPTPRRPWAPRPPLLLGIAAVLVTVALAGGVLGFLLRPSSGQSSTTQPTTPTPTAPKVIATIPVGTHPDGVAVAPDGRRAYVTNNDAGSVSMIDTATNIVTATIPVGRPIGVAATPGSRYLYVANADVGTVSVIDTTADDITATIPVGTLPEYVTMAPDGRHVYVANDSSNTVSVIDTATNTVTATLNVGAEPHGVAIAPDGRLAYVADMSANAVTVMDTANRGDTATIAVGQGPTGMAISPDGLHAYVTNYKSNTVTVIDTRSKTVTATVPVGAAPYGVATSPDGRRAYVTNFNSDTVSVIDVTTNKVIENINVGANPENVSIAPDGGRAYISVAGGSTLSVIDTGSI